MELYGTAGPFHQRAMGCRTNSKRVNWVKIRKTYGGSGHNDRRLEWILVSKKNVEVESLDVLVNQLRFYCTFVDFKLSSTEGFNQNNEGELTSMSVPSCVSFLPNLYSLGRFLRRNISLSILFSLFLFEAILLIN